MDFNAAIINVLLLFLAATSGLPASCPNLTFGSIPKDHIFHQKIKPIIIAHRGQPKVYQENTYDSIISVIGLKADGFELDIYKTKDDQLVVFHDDDTERMTGVKKIVWESTYDELQKLNIKTQIVAGANNYTFDKTRKIPLLEDILKVTKNTELLHYLEMKPSSLLSTDNDTLYKQTGELVADMVTKHNLVNKAIIVSFDYRKVYTVKKRNPKLTVGTLFSADKFVPLQAQSKIQTSFKNLSQCLQDAPKGGNKFVEFLFRTGILFKYGGSSSFDASIDFYNDTKYSNNTVSELRQNYRPDISTGFYTMYSMKNTEKKNKEVEVKLKMLIKDGGAHRVITDDVPRLRKTLGRHQSSSTLNLKSILHLHLFLLGLSRLLI